MGQVLQNHAKRRERQETVLQVRYGENAKNTVVANNVEFLPSEDEKGVKRPLEEIANMGEKGGTWREKLFFTFLAFGFANASIPAGTNGTPNSAVVC